MNYYFTPEGILGGMYFLFCSMLVWHRIGKSKRFETIDLTVLSMGGVYGLMLPLAVHGGGDAGIAGWSFLNENINYTFMHTLAAVMGAIGILLGWQLMSYRKRRRYGSFFSNVKYQTIILFLYLILFISFVTQYLYTKDYGGFLGYFEYNKLVRAGLFDNFERSRFSFLSPLGSLATISCVAFWGMLLSGGRRPSAVLGFILSFLFACYVVYASSGRISMATFVAIFPISLAIKYKINYTIWFYLFYIFFFISIFLLYLISNFLGINSADSIYLYTIKELSFPFVAFFANLSEGPSLLLFFPLLISPAYLLPSSFTSSWLLRVSDINTEIIMGSAKGVHGVTSGMPVDMLTFGFMQFHLLGVIIYSILIGYILRFFSEIAKSFNINGISYALSAYVMIKIGVFSVFYSQPEQLVKSHFSIIFTLILVVSARFVGRASSRSKIR